MNADHCVCLPPRCVIGEDVVILDAAARLGHHLGNGVAPGLIVGGLLVLFWGGGTGICFDQHVPSGKTQPFLLSPSAVLSVLCVLRNWS
jgi:hypothetical protein